VTTELAAPADRRTAQSTNWQKLLRCVRERRLPGRAKKLIPQLLSSVSGKTVIATRNGRKLFLKFDLADSPMADLILGEIFDAEVYFPRLTAWRDFNIQRGDTVIDIGANVGLFAVCAANRSRSGSVFCFEPSRENFARLVYHKKLNGMDNITTVNKGVSDKHETVKLYLVDKNCGAHSIVVADMENVQNSAERKYETIECLSLKQVFDQHQIAKCDFLKIDCEGAELRILSALPAQYFRRIDRIALEYHANVNVLEIAELLDRHGFSVTIKGYPVQSGLVFAMR